MSSFIGAVTMRCVVRSSRFQTKKVIIPQELDNFAWRFRLSQVELFVKKNFPTYLCRHLPFFAALEFTTP